MTKLLRRCVFFGRRGRHRGCGVPGAPEARPICKHRRHAAIHSQPYVYPQYEPQAAPPLWRQPCYSLDDCDRKAFDESGTRGRMGLGADPAHPEGPGNFSD